VLVVIVVVGILVYILNRKGVTDDTIPTQENSSETASTAGTNSSIESMSSLEVDVNSFDSNTDDVNPNDINF
jgi:hypothetical protein